MQTEIPKIKIKYVLRIEMRTKQKNVSITT